MIKFKHENMVYYYPNKQTLEAALRATIESQDNNIHISSSTAIANYADYIINSDDNAIIKNRAGVSMEELLDDFIQQKEQDAIGMKDIINKVRDRHEKKLGNIPDDLGPVYPRGCKKVALNCLDHLSMEERILRNKH